MKSQVFNPFLPSWEYVPDGEPRVFEGRLYLYGSHDAFHGADFCVNYYICWSAPVDDLSDWRFEGTIYRKDQDPRNTDGKMNMCAPDCVQGPDGRYYLYYQLHMLQCTCVAVSDSPAGPFDYYGCVRHPDGTPWGERKGDSFVFDPGVLVDDDGRVYLYAGFAPLGIMRTVFHMRGNRVEESVCLELEPDMITVRGEEHPIVPGHKAARGTEYAGHGFFEASSIRKIAGRYYYVYSSELSHELCYAVSDTPTGGFRYKGTLVSIADIGCRGISEPQNYTGNTHGGMVEVNGQWYIFYHRQTDRVKCSRQACAEKITIQPDGSIAQAEVTSCGLNDGPLAGKGRYEARIACNLGARKPLPKSDIALKKDKKNLLPYFTQSGEDREENPDQYLANVQSGSWCGFKYFRFDGSENCLRVTVRGTGEGTIRFFTDRSLPAIGSARIQGSPDWTSYSGEIKLPAGTSPLFFVYEGTGSVDFKEFEII
ncbi:MAG: family 43 glycosylhydrolase [Lachnospiraceae bacterium]|nr:family 43 glycosylhydrolase [Lachnospiraceae bacterium]